MTPHSPPAIAAPVPPAAAVQLDDAQLSLVARTLAQSVGRDRFVLSPDLVKDERRMSLALSGSADDVWKDGVAALKLSGVGAECAGKVGLCRFWLLPAPAPAAGPDEAAKSAVLSYLPRYRTVAFLASALKSMFSSWSFDTASTGGAAAPAVSASVGGGGGGAGAQGGGAEAGSARSQEAVPTMLVGVGPEALRAKINSVLPLLDQPVPAVTVHVAVYEIDDDLSQQSALQLVIGIINSASSIGVGVSPVPSAAGMITIKTPNFQAVVSALDTSSVAHLVTAPVLRASSGVVSSFAVGDSVPTLGSVSYAQGSSTPIQSVDYQQSGVVFSVLPEVVGNTIDLAIYQSISSFTATTVGVTASPTLQNRAVASQVTVAPGSVVVLGGLVERSETVGTQGIAFLPHLGSSKAHSRTSIVLVLQATVDG